jgi:molybdopterin-guanine dinucleotide biosynthesis protein A
MGADKALAEVAPGMRVVDLMLRTLGEVAEEVVAVTNDPGKFQGLPVRIVVDPVPFEGPLAGLREGLRAARSEWSLAVSCDLPLLRREFVERLWELRGEADAVVPRTGEHGAHPLCALYRRSCLGAVEEALARGEKRMVSFFPAIGVRWAEEAELREVEPGLASLVNVNTPQELERVRGLLRRRSPERSNI